MPLKVCFISHTSKEGGAEKALPKLLEALQIKGVKTYVLLPNHGPMENELKKRNITYHIYPYRMWMKSKTTLLRRILRIINNLIMVFPIAIRILKWKCDIIYTNTITVCVGAFAAKLLGKPHLWHIREFGYEDHGLNFDMGSRFSYWLIKQLSDLYVTNSYAVAEKYKKYVPEQKLKVVYEGYNINKNQLKSNSEKIDQNGDQKGYLKCVIIGTLQEGKGQSDAIQAIAELVRIGIKAHLNIVGEGFESYKLYLQRLISQNNLKNYVTFLGYLDNPLPLIQNSDIVLMCSRIEAFGLVTLEAMQIGKPIIGTKSGGTLELIKDGFNGLLYTPGNYEELAQKIDLLYRNPNLAKQMGDNGKKWAKEKFTLERYTNEMLAIFYQFSN
jgi:glycosyltransferase involved in cell wall biosynthesis